MRNASAFASALLVYLASAGALLFYLTLPQLALLCGTAAGLVASRREHAAALAALAVAAGWLIAPPVAGGVRMSATDVLALLACAAGAAAVAAAVHWAQARDGSAFVTAALVAIVTLLIADVWASALAHNAAGSLTAWLGTRPPPGTSWSDDTAFKELYRRILDGQGYYAAFRGIAVDNARWGAPPSSVFNVRPPALFLFLRALRMPPEGFFFGLLGLSSFSVAAAAMLSASLVRRQFCIAGAAAVASAFLGLCTTTTVLTNDSWGVALALISLGALAAAVRSRRWLSLFVTGAVFALLAASVREFYLCLPAAGLLAAFLAPTSRARTQKLAWSGVIALLAVYYAAHVTLASHILSAAAAPKSWLSPGFGNLVTAAGLFGPAFGPARWVAYLLGALGLLALLGMPSGQTRALLSATLGALVVFLLLFSSNAFAEPGVPLNYWGTDLMPLLFACVPVAIGLIPSMRRAQDAPTVGCGSR